MAKFETVTTMMYRYLCDELIEDINLSQDRRDVLIESGDFDLVIIEESYIAEKSEQLLTLEKYLELSEKSTCNRPHYIEISHFSEIGNKIYNDELNSYQLDDEPYYFKDSGINLKDWRLMDMTKIYIIGNLTIKRVNDELLSKYNHESVWYPISESDGFFVDNKDKKIYIKE